LEVPLRSANASVYTPCRLFSQNGIISDAVVSSTAHQCLPLARIPRGREFPLTWLLSRKAKAKTSSEHSALTSNVSVPKHPNRNAFYMYTVPIATENEKH